MEEICSSISGQELDIRIAEVELKQVPFPCLGFAAVGLIEFSLMLHILCGLLRVLINHDLLKSVALGGAPELREEGDVVMRNIVVADQPVRLGGLSYKPRTYAASVWTPIDRVVRPVLHPN
jgi:hypothetical protein